MSYTDSKEADTTYEKMPILKGRDVASCAKFLPRSTWGENKKKDNLNLVGSLDRYLKRTILEYGLPEARMYKSVVRSPAGDIISAENYLEEDFTAEIFLAWVEWKAGQGVTGGLATTLVKELTEELMKDRQNLFTYDEGRGTIEEQLQDWVSRVEVNSTGIGKETFSDEERITLMLRLLRPFGLARCAVLAMHAPSYRFFYRVRGKRSGVVLQCVQS
jgi:hypothetical protein